MLPLAAVRAGQPHELGNELLVVTHVGDAEQRHRIGAVAHQHRLYLDAVKLPEELLKRVDRALCDVRKERRPEVISGVDEFRRCRDWDEVHWPPPLLLLPPLSVQPPLPPPPLIARSPALAMQSSFP